MGKKTTGLTAEQVIELRDWINTQSFNGFNDREKLNEKLDEMTRGTPIEGWAVAYDDGSISKTFELEEDANDYRDAENATCKQGYELRVAHIQEIP